MLFRFGDEVPAMLETVSLPFLDIHRLAVISEIRKSLARGSAWFATKCRPLR